MFRIDVLGAHHGDCLVIHYGLSNPPRRILVDGGPHKVYRPFLKPHLKSLRESDGLDKPVEFELAMVSHIDQDHIMGLLEMTDDMIEEDDSTKHAVSIRSFWHNSFSDLTGGATPAALTATIDSVVASSEAGVAIPFDDLENGDGRAVEILASVNQGRKLRDNLVLLGLDGNKPFNHALVLSGKSAELIDDMTLTVIGPDADRLHDLQQKWNPNLNPSEIASISDKSVSNLASIVVLVEHNGQTVLLTGDARGDDIVEWLEAQGLKQPGQPYEVDVLKVPHHGSDRNVDLQFFKDVPAAIYVYCGDGGHDNPSPETLKMMRDARNGENYSVVFSGPVKMKHDDQQPLFDAEMQALIDAGVNVEMRAETELFIPINL